MTPADFALQYFGKLDDAGNVAVPPTATAFRTDVKVTSVLNPGTVTNGTSTQDSVDMVFCATNKCAADLVKLLSPLFAPAPPAILYDHPFAGWPIANMYTESDVVPFLLFSGVNVHGDAVTYAENAGQLAEAFAHGGYPPDTVLNQVVGWIRMDLQAAVPSQQ